MPDVQMTPMTTDELAAYLAYSQDDYAHQRVEFGGETPAQAAESARTSFEELFPGGSPGPDQHLFIGRDGDGERVGILWLARREHADRVSAWIYDIEVDEDRRRQGWGRALMAYAEQWAQEQGASQVGLNVFGGNTSARDLYRDLGYAETSVQMAKPVT